MTMNESAENYLETILVLSHSLPVVRSVDILTFVFQRGYQRFDPGKAHLVDTATVGAFGRTASVRCDLLV